MYKRVLLPVSGQSRCARALAALEKARKVCDGELIILHVTEPTPQTVGGEARLELEEQKKAQGLLTLGPIIEKLEALNLPFHVRVISGTPAETIVQAADEENADLIVMFTDGRDGLKDMIVGSITERVLRNLDIDLLAVRAPKQSQEVK